MNTEQESLPPSLAVSLSGQLSALPFDRVAANAHYTAGSPENLRNRQQTVDQFLQDDELIEPDVQPRKYNFEAIGDAIAQYESALSILVAQKDRTEEEELLIDRLIRKSGELFRYEELMLAFGATALADQVEHRRLAAEHSMELIGGIDQSAFDELLYDLREDARHSSQSYAKELLALTVERPRPETTGQMIELEDATREVIGRDLGILFPGLNELLIHETNMPVSPDEALPLFGELLKIGNLYDWTAKLSAGKVAETHTATKMVTIGEQRPDFKNLREAVGVGVHECLIHAGRSEGIVHPDVGDFEEGIATRLQQVITGEKRTPGVQYYISIGLQIGADRGGVPRSYRETFEIMWRREALRMEVSGGEVDIQKARAQAQRHVQRTRRGGEVDTNDAAYFTGAQKAAQWLNQISFLPEAARRSLLAKVLTNKYDPTDPEQAVYIDRRV